jgi:hypothetical protein
MLPAWTFRPLRRSAGPGDGPDLDAVAFSEADELTIAAEAVRLRHDRVLVATTN